MLNALRTDNSPFSERQIAALQQGLGELDPAQTAWLSGFIAGQLMTDPGVARAVPETPQAKQGSEELNLFYASQTGNGEQISDALARQAEQNGLAIRVQSLNQLRPAALKKIRHAAFVISTHGEGDPPDDALDLIEYLESPRAPRLESLSFRVLALGDSSYSQFCEAGRRLEKLLLARGATLIAERVECDLDYDEAAARWSEEILEYSRAELATQGAPQGVNGGAVARLSLVPAASEWNRKRPFAATVERVQKITGLGSTRDVHHVELSLGDSGLRYEPGDSLGVWAPNSEELVAKVLSGLGIEPGTQVESDGRTINVAELLTRERELTRLTADVTEAYAAWTSHRLLEQRLERLNAEEKREFMEQRQFIDLVEEFPARLDAQQLAGMLRPLAPRSYSIASSQAAVGDEVHLTVATMFSDAIGSQRRGVASDYLNYRLQPGDEIGVFPEPNRRFRLPDDRSTPIIMIAAGTGIAPYRAFLQQLEEEGAAPDTWLIFGNPHARTDFLYQREWLNWRSGGLISRIDCAFSREEQEKRYVQHVVAEQAAEIDVWLGRGAQLYLCGGLAMGHQTELALQNGIARNRGLDEEAAAAVVSDLRRDRRLLKDLY